MCRTLSLLFCVATLVTLPACADTFTGTGTTSDGHAISASATFTFNGSSLTLILTNLTSPLNFLNQVLTNIEFDLNATSLVLNSVVASGEVTCTDTAGPDCISTAFSGSSPFGWVFASPPSGFDFHLAAGNGSLKPFGIVNSTISTTSCPSANGGLCNSVHNPYLLGPVTFNITASGLGTTPVVSNVQFSFGTRPDLLLANGPTPIPEPASMLLFGSGLLGVGAALRRRRTKS